MSPNTAVSNMYYLPVQGTDTKNFQLKLSLPIFAEGFSHKDTPIDDIFDEIDLYVVRLCFQAFRFGPNNEEIPLLASPVVSEPVYDRSALFIGPIFVQNTCSPI